MEPGKTKIPKKGSKKDQQLKGGKERARETLQQWSPPIPYLHENVLICLFANPKSLAACMGRVHEAYEGGNALKGPLKGVNMPVQFWRQFLDSKVGEEASLSEAEEYMERLLAKASTLCPSGHEEEGSTEGQLYYVIACLKGDTSSLLHEWAHAIYYKDSSYSAIVSDIYSNLDRATRNIIESELRLRKYQEKVFEDEFQAYVLESPIDFGKRLKEILTPIHRKLRTLINLPNLNQLKSFDLPSPLPLENC